MGLLVGDLVVLRGVPDSMYHNLEQEEINAIKAQIGKTHKIVGFNEIGWVEIEFKHDDVFHFIWVEPMYVDKTTRLQPLLCWLFRKVYARWLWNVRVIKVISWRTAIVERKTERTVMSPCFWWFQ